MGFERDEHETLLDVYLRAMESAEPEQTVPEPELTEEESEERPLPADRRHRRA
jgi:hypothetical protein